MRKPSRCVQRDALRLAIASIVLAPYMANAAIIQPAFERGDKPIVIDAAGRAPVIDIVAPNATGLSHNRYEQYNVGVPGVVLNNSLQAGRPQVGGQFQDVQANAQFKGQAASTILNEVIGRRRSDINGEQVIFGQAADYVLSNPNGISLNGARVNLGLDKQATFLVGRPEIENGRITRLNTRDDIDPRNALRVSQDGLTVNGGSLALIAPTIDQQGPISAAQKLDILLGTHKVDAETMAITDVRQTSYKTDARLMGAMRADRINILSTRDGAGINMGIDQVRAVEGIDIASRGDLKLSSTALRDGLVTQGVLNGGAGDVRLTAAGDLDITSVALSGAAIVVDAGANLNLDTLTRTVESSHRTGVDNDWYLLPAGATTTTVDKKLTEHLVNRLDAGSVTLNARNDARLASTHIKSTGDIAIRAGGALEVTANVDHKIDTVTVSNEREGAHRRDSSARQTTQTAASSYLEGQSVSLAGRAVKVKGSDVESRSDLHILGTESVEIGTVTLHGAVVQDSRDGHVIARRSKTELHDREQTVDQRNSLLAAADGKVEIKGGQIDLIATQVHARDIALQSLSRDIGVQGVQATQRIENARLDTALFSSSDRRYDRRQSTYQGSSLNASGSMVLDSKRDTRIIGSNLTAQGDLSVNADGHLTVAAGEQHSESTLKGEDWKLTVFGEQAGPGSGQPSGETQRPSGQWTGGIGLREQWTLDTAQLSTHQASALKGKNVALDAGKTLAIVGSSVEAEQDAYLGAEDIRIMASEARRSFRNQETGRTLGYEITAGVDRVGVGFSFALQTDTDGQSENVHTRSTVKAGHDVSLKADTLTTKAALVEAGHLLTVRADQVHNQAATDTTKTALDYNKIKLSFGGSLDYSAITRQVQKLWTGVDQTSLYSTGLEGGLLPWSIGVNLKGDYLDRSTQSMTSIARVSEFRAGDIDIAVNGKLHDVGTQYESTVGAIALNAGSHVMDAARNSVRTSIDSLGVDAIARLETSTGADWALGAAARGYSSAQHKTVETAVAGSLTGKTGIAIQLGTDGLYEGTFFSSSEGPIRIDSGGSLQLRQANNSIVKHDDGTRGRGAAQLNGVIVPAPVIHGGAIGGDAQYTVLDSTQTFAVGGSISTPGSVTLNAKGDVVMQGTGIGSTNAPVERLSINAGQSIVVLAGVDTAKADGNVYGGSGSLKVSARQPSGGLPLAGAAGFEVGQTQEDSTLRTGAKWHVRQDVELNAGSKHAAAILLQGLHATADSIKLEASNGGIHVGAAQSTSDRDNKLISASFSAGGATSGAKGGAERNYSVDEFSVKLKFDYDKLKSRTYANAQLTANTVEFSSPGALVLAGAQVHANDVRGSVGSLQAMSMKDDVDATKVKVEAELGKGGNPWGAIGSLSKLAGQWGSAAKARLDSVNDKYSTPVSVKFDFDMRRELRDSVAQSTVLNGRDGIGLNVLGTTQLVGAKLQTTGTLVAPDNGRVETSDLASRDRLVTVSALALTPGLSDIKTVYEHLRKDKPQELLIDTGLFRAGGHNTTQYLTGSVEKHSL